MAATKTATHKKATSTSSGSTKKAATRKTTAKKAPAKRLHEREPRTVAEDAGYAAAALVEDAVELAKGLPSRLEATRTDLRKAAEEAPSRAQGTVKGARERVGKQVDAWLKSFEKTFDTKAKEGRKIVESVRKDERVARVLEQTGSTRSQLKAAVTSVRKTADVAVLAGRKQAETASSQVKAAATSVRKSAETVADAATNGGSEN